ncbi:MAG: prepilin-type N-terminal cleavage/methylation domain-containing protein [Tepidisphaera sp.]|jgi:prepilin-type N-terminal cleavage/methylation domain-containing protein
MNRRKLNHASRAFSMLELTFVLVVIGVLLAVAAFNFGTFTEKAKIKATKATMSIIKQSIQMYNGENSAYPTALQALVPGYIDPNKPLVDGWNRPFYYEPNPTDPNRPYSLRSNGTDGISGSADDIDVWTMNNPGQ